MAKKVSEVPGNAVESQRIFDKEVYAIGKSLMQLSWAIPHLEETGIVVKAIRFAYRNGPEGEVLAVITAETEGADLVAFSSGDTLVQSVQSLGSRIRNGSLKWKEDQYGNK